MAQRFLDSTVFNAPVDVNGTLSVNSLLEDNLGSAGTTGQVLTKDGSNKVAWTTPSGGGNISGSGTAGTMTKFSGASTITDSSHMTEDATGIIIGGGSASAKLHVKDNVKFGTDGLFYNHSAKRVGLGTITPDQLLTVNGNMRLIGGFYDGSNQIGISGQVLESTGTATRWVTPATGMSSFTIDGNVGTSNTITDGETLSINGSTGISTSVSTNTISIINTDRGSVQNIFKNFAVVGGSTIVADNNNDTLSFNTGVGLDLLTDTGTDTITFSPKITNLVTSNCLQTTNTSTSWYYIPFDGSSVSTTRSLAHNLVAPFTGYVRSISYRGAGLGTATSATTLKYRVLRNGTVIYTSGTLSLGTGTSSSKSVQLNISPTSATFTQLFRLEIQFQTNAALQSSLFSIELQES